MTKLWRVPGVNMELHTAETCDRPGAYLVAILPETDRPLTIRALKRVAQRHDIRRPGWGLEPMWPVDVYQVLETMPLADRFVPPPKAPEIAPPTAEEVAAIHAHFLGRVTNDWQGMLRDMLSMFVEMRNTA